MPCDSVVTVDVVMGINTDSGLLFDALKRLKASPARTAEGISFSLGASSGFYRSGKLEISLRGWDRSADLINKIKSAYAREVVLSAVRRVGGSSLADASQPNIIHVSLAPRWRD